MNALELRSTKITAIVGQWELNVDVAHQPGPVTKEMLGAVQALESRQVTKVDTAPRATGVAKR